MQHHHVVLPDTSNRVPIQVTTLSTVHQKARATVALLYCCTEGRYRRTQGREPPRLWEVNWSSRYRGVAYEGHTALDAIELHRSGAVCMASSEDISEITDQSGRCIWPCGILGRYPLAAGSSWICKLLLLAASHIPEMHQRSRRAFGCIFDVSARGIAAKLGRLDCGRSGEGVIKAHRKIKWLTYRRWSR